MITWIKNGELVDPVKGAVEKVDLIIEKGRVAKILPHKAFNDKGVRIKVIYASNK